MTTAAGAPGPAGAGGAARGGRVVRGAYGRPVAGVVLAPALDEHYTARQGGGARCNGLAIRASAARGSSPNASASSS